MTYTHSHQARLEEARESGEVAGREYQIARDDHTLTRDEWTYLLGKIQENPWAPGVYTEDVTPSEAKHLAKTWDLHFASGRHQQQAESGRKNAVNRSAA